MNKDRIRITFMGYRRRIEALQDELQSCEHALAEREHYAREQIGYARASAERARQDAENATEERRTSEYQRQSDVRRATDALESSRFFGDRWGTERAIDQLKRLR